jgi:hypothetical protein
LLDTDPKRSLARRVAGLAGLSILAWGLGAILWRGELLHYRIFFGKLVFAPFAILFGVIIIIIVGALFKPEILGKAPKRLKR